MRLKKWAKNTHAIVDRDVMAVVDHWFEYRSDGAGVGSTPCRIGILTRGEGRTYAYTS